MITLEQDQKDSINKVLDLMNQKCKSILLQGATGSGKSIIGSEILRRARAKNKRVWFMVPRRNLIEQMHRTFDQFGIEHSYIAAGMSMNPHSPAYICSMETLRRRLEKTTAPHLAIVDETHFGGDGLDSTIAWLKERGTWIVGLSATPWTLSGEGLGCWYDRMVTGPSIRWLIDNGRLSDYRPFRVSPVDLSRISVVGGDYSKSQLSQRMEQDNVLIGNAVKHYKDHARGRRNIAYCVSIKHSQKVAEAFRDGGVVAAHIDGETPDDERRRIIRAFARREIEVLTNCELLTFGFDLASQVESAGDGRDVTIEAMSDLRPTKSLALQMQKWGRVLRKKDDPALIFDHANSFKEHGFPCDERYWTLEDRVKIKTGGGEKTIPVRSCPACYYCHRPAPKCPNVACTVPGGYIYPVESREIKEIEGELLEIKIREKIEIEKEKKKARMRIGMAKTLDDLRAIAQDNGYHWKWIERQAIIKGIEI